MFLDSTFLLILPALALSMFAQYKVKSAYNKYSTIRSTNGYNRADAARELLLRSGVNDVRVEPTSGMLTDHYDPRSKVVRLSEGVYNSSSLAALGIAAHEVGHAVQHNVGYMPLGLRSALVPVTGFGSKLAVPLILVGLFLAQGAGSFGLVLAQVGIILYSVAVLFTLITLPVEFNASGRAIELLSENRFLTDDEVAPTKKVLNAAALTYVAATITAIMTLLRFIMIVNRRR